MIKACRPQRWPVSGAGAAVRTVTRLHFHMQRARAEQRRDRAALCSKSLRFLYALQGMTIVINSGRSVSVASVRRCCRVCWVTSLPSLFPKSMTRSQICVVVIAGSPEETDKKNVGREASARSLARCGVYKIRAQEAAYAGRGREAHTARSCMSSA